MIQKEPIFITGIQRSGSTMIAKILQQSGVFCGEVNSTMEHYKIGYLIGEMCRKNNSDVKGQYPLPKFLPSTPIKFQTRLENCIKEEGYEDGKNWFIKGHRLAQYWKVFHTIYPNAKWIIVRRRTPDVIESCLKTAYMNRFNDSTILKSIRKKTVEEGWLWWIHKNESFLNGLIRSTSNYQVVWPERMAQGDYSQIQGLHKWLGIDYNEKDIKKLIEPMMEHSKQKVRK